MPDVQLVGIVNVTPDSFSDGGKAFAPSLALAAIEQLIYDGADVVDIGAESTRPGATPLSPEEEWARLAPVLEALHRFDAVSFSVDTRHASTARRALECGVQWINDVSGFSSPDMVDAVRGSYCRLVMMHSLGVPADKAIVLPESCNVVGTLMEYARDRLLALENAGIARNRIIFDPGIGFGKTARQSHDIVQNIREFTSLGVPLLVGHSRKSFLGGDMTSRDAATLAMSQQLAQQGVIYLRVHDVAAHRSIFRKRAA